MPSALLLGRTDEQLVDRDVARPRHDVHDRICDVLGVKPLEFDGRTDSLFQPFDNAGRRHMEYVVDRGTFPDVPFENILADFRANYAAMSAEDRLAGDFQAEAVTGIS